VSNSATANIVRFRTVELEPLRERRLMQKEMMVRAYVRNRTLLTALPH
jgi:hypothetical protein